MHGFAAAGIVVTGAIIVLWENLLAKERAAKAAVVTITACACILSIALLFMPELTGPTDWVMPLFRPIAKWIGLE
ncbi:hypothetical protein ACFPVX_16310 [Cohnella faecalis]|uniref:Uncharacterized protein n=1 Tax=Cohnella faecalis TaxID=2315694 RepID=A0A398CN99_9BACL|nr:hypothetical protein [Cohnella faecalis]RIE02719.1 hypothetical protein D3H35_18900 [Cohnella faecalis]